MSSIPARTPPLPAHRLAGVLLALLAVVAAIVLLSSDPHVFVALTSDREGQALLPISTLAPGSSTTGQLTLANEGLLPMRYELRVEGGHDEMNSGVIIRIRRNGAANYLYQGPLSAAPIAIGTLAPGQRDQLQVTLAALPSESTFSIPIDDTFVWTARSPGVDSWWWLLLVASALVLGAFAMPRLLALWAWLRARRTLPFELYWRAPLVLAAILLATLVPLTGVSLSTINAQASNPANVFAVGALVLSDQAPARASCLSVSSNSQSGGPGQCDAIFQFTQAGPGRSSTGRLTVRNVGTVPIHSFAVFTGGCESQALEKYHGTADACAAVLLTLHDDRHDVCYYPVSQKGACPTSGGGTLRTFARDFGSARPLPLDPDGLGAGIPFTFTVTVDPSASNDTQGLTPTMNFTWQVAQ
jgi:hypothetical protein